SSRTCRPMAVSLSPQRANDNVELSRACKRAPCEDSGQGPVQEEKCARGGGAAADEKVAGVEPPRERLEGPQAQVAQGRPSSRTFSPSNAACPGTLVFASSTISLLVVDLQRFGRERFPVLRALMSPSRHAENGL
ncbi:hypothetical protein K488DRAFT_75401, partial [Vararia minispora EC-137]